MRGLNRGGARCTTTPILVRSQGPPLYAMISSGALACLFLLALNGVAWAETLVLDEEFNTLNLSLWQHEITLGGGGKWEFEYYTNNRTNSYVKDGVLYIQPTFLVDDIGEANLKNGYTMDIWGAAPGDYCTSNQFYSCMRPSGARGNYLNPIKSARICTANI